MTRGWKLYYLIAAVVGLALGLLLPPCHRCGDIGVDPVDIAITAAVISTVTQ